MTVIFGKPWDAPAAEDATLAETPVGQPCMDCREAIVEGDRGLMMPIVGVAGSSVQPMHLECLLRQITPHPDGCTCHEGGDSGMTLREEGLAVLAKIERERGKPL